MPSNVFTTPDQLIRLLETVIKDISDKQDGTTREYFCLYLLLLCGYNHSTILPQYEIIKRESPDFCILGLNKKIGVEHTRATLESFKIAESELKKHQKHPDGSIIELSHYSPSNEPSKKQADIGIVHPGDKLHGAGWAGNRTELDWAEIVMNAIIKKTALFNDPQFQKFGENHLIIDNNDSPASWFNDTSESLTILKKQYKETPLHYELMFNQIHVLSGNSFIIDMFGECIRIDVSKKNLHIEGIS